MTKVPIIDQPISAVAPVLHRDTINLTIPATQDAFVDSVEAFFDKISDTTVNELNQVTTKIDATVSAINIVAQEISEATTIAIVSGQYKGDWVTGFETTGYSLGDGVTFTDGYNYVSKINNNLTTPITLTNTDQWNFIEAVNPNNYYLKTETYTNTEVDTLHKINNKTAKTTPVDTDNFLIEEISGLFKKLSWTNIKATIISSFGVMISTLIDKTTPVDADIFIIGDSTATNTSKKLSWTNIKATIISSFGVMISTLIDKTTPVDADIFIIGDSTATNTSKKLTWANIKATLETYFDTLYFALTGSQTVNGIKTFTSSPIVPTPSSADNSTKVATTEFVRQNIDTATVNLTVGAIGTYSLLLCTTVGQSIIAGSLYSGSSLKHNGYQSVLTSGGSVAAVAVPSTTITGTWRAMGNATVTSGGYANTLFLRIS